MAKADFLIGSLSESSRPAIVIRKSNACGVRDIDGKPGTNSYVSSWPLRNLFAFAASRGPIPTTMSAFPNMLLWDSIFSLDLLGFNVE
ncbi:hypothetical protein D3C84_1160750 [compost metagenome]